MADKEQFSQSIKLEKFCEQNFPNHLFNIAFEKEIETYVINYDTKMTAEEAQGLMEGAARTFPGITISFNRMPF